ncbi:hypothetical protein CHUAL_003141 [Chamberlinius hualienensis]
MDDHVVVKVSTAVDESINDIKNYLASFNKEIQDGDASGVGGGGSTGGSGESEAETTTYYVATDAGDSDEATAAAFQSALAAATAGATGEQFNGNDGTFYQTSYYTENGNGTTAEGSTDGQQYTFNNNINNERKSVHHHALSIGTATTTTTLSTSAGTVTPSTAAGRRVALTTGNRRGVNQLAATGESAEATEISVTIPAALAGQTGAEELLQAVEAQDGSTEHTYVAMQQGGQPVVVSRANRIAQSKGRQTIRMVVQQPDGTERHEDLEVPTADASDGTLVSQELSQGATLQMMASLTGSATSAESVLNSGNGYQTVTLVPSEGSAGEVSYVLIVSQPEDEKVEHKMAPEVDVDMSVYDFNEGEQQGGQVETDVKDSLLKVTAGNVAASSSRTESSSRPVGGGNKPARVVKLNTKKSQSVTQAHMCNYCNYTSPKRYLLSRHMKSHSEERPHKCSVCERGFKTLASLQNHVNTHTGTRPHQCKVCESAFTTSGELVRHVRYRHTHEKPHRCTDCDYASVELSKLKRHMRCHTGERPYQCPHCTYASPDTYKLKRHLRIHTGEKPYECDICHARFTQSNSLKAHKLIHTGQKPVFQCELCPTTCGRKTDLRIHVQKLHTSERPLKCRRCGKSFPDRYTYKVHTKTHDGEKCFKCDLCPYASISQRHLESHMLIHTDQKPYQCDKCDQAFRQKQLLKRHRNLYHDPNYVPPTPKEKTHQCAECLRAFRHKGNLIRHMAIHDPDATAQEKEAAMQVIKTFKRINENGEEEEYTDEEDDFDDDDDVEEEDELTGADLTVGRQITTRDGQQVVVLEVIQLQGPEGEQQTVAVLAGDTMEVVDESGQLRGATVVQADGDTSTIEGLGEALNQLGGATFLMEAAPKKKKKRNRKLQLLANDIVQQLENGELQLTPAGNSGRPARVKRRKTEDADYIYMTPTKKARRSSTSTPVTSATTSTTTTTTLLIQQPQQTVKKVKKVIEPEVPSEEELARREAEAENKRLAQKQKDIDECFGFKDDNDDEDEDEDVGHSSAATESTLRLLNAMHGHGSSATDDV